MLALYAQPTLPQSFTICSLSSLLFFACARNLILTKQLLGTVAIDEEGIAIIGVRNEIKLKWSEIEECQTTDLSNNLYRLKDVHGKTIFVSIADREHSIELSELLEERLSKYRSNFKDRVDHEALVIKGKLTLSHAPAVFGSLCLFGLSTHAFTGFHPSNVLSFTSGLLLSISGMANLALLIRTATSSITLDSKRISTSSLLGKGTLEWSELTRIELNGLIGFNSLKLISRSGKEISVPASTPDKIAIWSYASTKLKTSPYNLSEESKWELHRKQKKLKSHLFIISMICSIVGSLNFWLAHTDDVKEAREISISKHQGIMTNGTVVKLDRPSQTVVFQFDAGGSSIQNRKRVPFREFETISLGDPVIVKYVPGNPANSHIQQETGLDIAGFSMNLFLFGSFSVISVVTAGLLCREILSAWQSGGEKRGSRRKSKQLKNNLYSALDHFSNRVTTRKSLYERIRSYKDKQLWRQIRHSVVFLFPTVTTVLTVSLSQANFKDATYLTTLFDATSVTTPFAMISCLLFSMTWSEMSVERQLETVNRLMKNLENENLNEPSQFPDLLEILKSIPFYDTGAEFEKIDPFLNKIAFHFETMTDQTAEKITPIESKFFVSMMKLSANVTSKELIPLLSSVLKASPLFADESYYQQLKIVLKNSRHPTLSEAITITLPEIRKRLDGKRHCRESELLIASSPPVGRETLLRPVSSRPETAIDSLMRPVNSLKNEKIVESDPLKSVEFDPNRYLSKENSTDTILHEQK